MSKLYMGCLWDTMHLSWETDNVMRLKYSISRKLGSIGSLQRMTLILVLVKRWWGLIRVSVTTEQDLINSLSASRTSWQDVRGWTLAVCPKYLWLRVQDITYGIYFATIGCVLNNICVYFNLTVLHYTTTSFEANSMIVIYMHWSNQIKVECP